MITFATFVATRLGQSDQVDHIGSGQCVDLVNDYVAAVWGRPHLVGNAVDLFGNAPAVAYLKTRNAPANWPPIGAVVTWDPTPAVGIGPYGHCALCLLADRERLVTLDQDWPPGARVSVVVHDYRGVHGWLVDRV